MKQKNSDSINREYPLKVLQFCNSTGEVNLINETKPDLLVNTCRDIVMLLNHQKNGKTAKTGDYSPIVYAIVSIALGIFMFIFQPNEMFTQLRIRMIPGFFAFQWWLEPPVGMIVNIYLFNVTNAEAFLGGTDSKMKFQEIGPISCREILTHTNPVFNENGTFSYTSKRELVYSPESNAADILNATVVMPNLAALVVPSFISNAPFAVKFGMNIMMRKYKTQLLKTTTIYDYLWNTTDPIVDASRTVAPGIFSLNNVGVMAVIYANLETTATVYIAPKYDRTQFFKIDKYDGSEYLPKMENNCHDKLVGAVDDVMYNLDITKNETLRFYSKALCRMTRMEYVEEAHLYGMTTYRFDLPETFFNRTFPEEEDCYKGSPMLPNGLSDCGPCYFGSSVSASFPHFLHSKELQQQFDGLNPSKEVHESYVLVEPSTGIPLGGISRLQMNIAVKNMRGFTPQLRRFSNLVIPLCWTEFTSSGYPWYVISTVYMTVRVLPVAQVVVPILLIMVGFFISYRYLCRRVLIGRMKKDQIVAEEYDMFLEKEKSMTDFLTYKQL